MKSVLTKKHFEFYCDEDDKDCIKGLCSSLEENYDRITDDLQAVIQDKINVYIYHDLTAYHKTLNIVDAPNWLVGNAWGNNLYMVSPIATGIPHTYDDMMKVITHEFTHIVISNINHETEKIPIWLNEGIAVYEARQINRESFSAIRSSSVFPSLEDLKTESISFGNNNGYLYSFSIIDFIVDRFGHKMLNPLIKAPWDFEPIIGMTNAEFEKQWIHYVKTINEACAE